MHSNRNEGFPGNFDTLQDLWEYRVLYRPPLGAPGLSITCRLPAGGAAFARSICTAPE
jgi:hypothetical protein